MVTNRMINEFRHGLSACATAAALAVGMAGMTLSGASNASAATAAHAVAASTVSAAATVIDVAGRTVKVPANPQRILLGESRLLSAVALLEGKRPLARIVGWQGDLPAMDPQTYDAYGKQFPQIRDIPLIGKATEDSINPEKALALKPDVAVFSLAGHGPSRYSALVKQLEAIGTTVVFVDFRVKPMENTVPSMELLGRVLHREREADAYVKFYQAHLAAVQKVVATIPESQRPKVFIDLLAGIWDGGCCHTAGNGSFGDFINAAGGRNIAQGLLPGALGDLSMEQIITASPDVYIATGSHSKPGFPSLHVGATTGTADARKSLADLVSRPGFDAIKAIHAGNVHGITHNYYDSPFNILAIETFAKWFYPDKFATLDVNATRDAISRDFLAVRDTGTEWIDLNPAAK